MLLYLVLDTRRYRKREKHKVYGGLGFTISLNFSLYYYSQSCLYFFPIPYFIIYTIYYIKVSSCFYFLFCLKCLYMNEIIGFEFVKSSDYLSLKKKKKFVKDDLKYIFELAKRGVGIKDIATTLKYDVETLENNPTVVECIENGNAIFRCNLLSTQVDKALNTKDTKMLIWLGKQYLGQKDNTNDEFKSEQFIIECDVPDVK